MLYIYMEESVNSHWASCFRIWQVKRISDLPKGSYSELENQLARIGRAGAMLEDRDKVKIAIPQALLTPDKRIIVSRCGELDTVIEDEA